MCITAGPAGGALVTLQPAPKQLFRNTTVVDGASERVHNVVTGERWQGI